MLDTSNPKEWSHPQKIWKDDRCPSCGYDSSGHVTVFVEQQIGRRCLECGSTWPIEVSEETEAQHYVAFRDPRAEGKYRKEPFQWSTMLEIRKFCSHGGGFWSLVRGDHATLATMEILRTTVTNVEKPWVEGQKPPPPQVGDEILVVVPEEEFVEWADETVDDFCEDPRGRKLPIPLYKLEKWTRVE